jgi:OmpA-OmpF porin, OOP family
MLDSIISMAAEKFGLGGKARDLVTMVIKMIFDKDSGGFSGFQQKFSNAGLGDLFKSWIGGNPGTNELQPDQVARVFGDSGISQMASKLGLPNSAITNSLAGLLPGIVGKLTTGGRIPTEMPDLAGMVSGFATNAGGSARAAVADAASSGGGGLGFLKWLLPLLLIGAAIWWFMGRNKEAPAPAEPVAPAVVEPAAPVEPAPAPEPAVVSTNSQFSFESLGDKVNVSGQVASEEAKTKLWGALTTAFGDGNVNGDIKVDAALGPANWMDKLLPLIPELKAKGVKFGFDGDKLNLDTSALAEADRFAISDKIRAAFAGFEISGLWDKASVALSGLKPGFTGDDLVAALNLMNIQFNTGSAVITNDSMEIVNKAADVLKQAPADLKVEVGGHTDNVGKAASNQKLSDERANAVRGKLIELGVGEAMLSAKGYGDANPKADNGSAEGRAQNRRIEFSVQKM